MKKTFSKKKNQRRTIYVCSSLVIVSLLFSLGVTQVNANRKSTILHQQLKQTQVEKKQKVETLSKSLQALKEAKAVTDSRLKQKAVTEARMRSQIDKLKASLQAQKKIVASVSAPRVRAGGRGGESPVSLSNTYDRGYCTWYVKNRRPDIPNGWGDANEWLGNAQRQGWATGSVPRVGSVGTTSSGLLGHVVYVEGVNGDGTINIAEMNVLGWNVLDRVTVSASKFYYIY